MRRQDPHQPSHRPLTNTPQASQRSSSSTQSTTTRSSIALTRPKLGFELGAGEEKRQIGEARSVGEGRKFAGKLGSALRALDNLRDFNRFRCFLLANHGLICALTMLAFSFLRSPIFVKCCLYVLIPRWLVNASNKKYRNLFYDSGLEATVAKAGHVYDDGAGGFRGLRGRVAVVEQKTI